MEIKYIFLSTFLSLEIHLKNGTHFTNGFEQYFVLDEGIHIITQLRYARLIALFAKNSFREMGKKVERNIL